jgi:uncharacterized protein YjbI with pentapeptide repeats
MVNKAQFLIMRILLLTGVAFVLVPLPKGHAQVGYSYAGDGIVGLPVTRWDTGTRITWDYARPFVNWSGGNFYSAGLDGSRLYGANLSNGIFQNALMRWTDLREVNMTGVSFFTGYSSPGLQNSIFSVGTIFPDGKNYLQTTFPWWQFEGFVLAGLPVFRWDTNARITWDWASPNKNWANQNLSYANLNLSDLSGAVLSGANLSQAKMLGVNLQGADLTNANMTNTELVGASYSEMTKFNDGKTYQTTSFNYVGAGMLLVPEPSVLSLLAVGLGGLAMMRRRRS